MTASFLEKNINNMDIVIKPHHLLDIFKLYGKGIENFVPDKNYNHNFYFIGNAVIRNEVNKICFTYSYDDICKPCYHLKNSVCSDYFSADGVDINKNEYNEKLDIRLMKLLNLKFDEIYEFKDIIELFNSEVSLKLINLAWYSSNQDDNKIRYELTKKGIYKVSIGGGEPFLKNLEEIIKRTSSKMKFSITTNGSIVRDQFIKLFLNNKNIKITISLDSLENEKSNLIRKNIDVNKVIENIKKLCEHEELRERLSIRTTISTINYKEAYDIIRFCEDNKIKNLKINQIENIKFYSGDVEKILPELINTEKIKPDVVFVDPPRKGLDNKTIEILNKTKPEQIIYISCNPATMVRDLQKLENDYIIKEIQPVDMFPYTSHVECVSLLCLK